jgi:hypothetical protein
MKEGDIREGCGGMVRVSKVEKISEIGRDREREREREREKGTSKEKI